MKRILNLLSALLFAVLAAPHARHGRHPSLSVKLLPVLLSCMLVCLDGLRAADYFSPAPIRFQATGFFRLATTQGRDHLVTPDGRAYVALGVNHIGALQQDTPGSVTVRGNPAWETYWDQTLRARFADWNFTTLGYGAPTALRAKAPWFGTITVARIEKHRSEPKPTSRDGYEFPDVFDPAWEAAIQEDFAREVAPWRDDPLLVGWFWTDTPTWDVLRTRALRGTDWVSAMRALPAGRPGREAYAAFLAARYANRLADLNSFYGLSFGSLATLRDADLRHVAVGRHVVQEDDQAFLGVIARRYYEVTGKAQRQADPNHLVFGDRYLAGDHPEKVLQAVKPWIDAVAVQPGDRYSPLYPPSTEFPDAEIEALHTVTGRPVLICDHAISFPTAAHPLTIFEQMPDEVSAAKATRSFLAAAFAKPWMLGYLRCQYIDRPAGFGRGLRQGLLQGDGTPRERIVGVYREAFGGVLKGMKELNP